MKHSRSPLRRSIALCAALALATLSAGAFCQNYTVTINPTLNGLDVKFAYQANEDSFASRSADGLAFACSTMDSICRVTPRCSASA